MDHTTLLWARKDTTFWESSKCAGFSRKNANGAMAALNSARKTAAILILAAMLNLDPWTEIPVLNLVWLSAPTVRSPMQEVISPRFCFSFNSFFQAFETNIY